MDFRYHLKGNINTMGLFKLTPYVKQAIWGGRKLYNEYGKRGFEEIAETWELSAFAGKESTVVGGQYDGLTVTALIAALGGRSAIGTKSPEDGSLPLLIKFIDSASPLSIQVHPDAETAAKIGGDAASKTEMWVICEADEGAFIYFGMKDDTSPDDFAAAIRDGSITEKLNRVPVKAGDVFFIPSGTIHAIGAWITICEIQETSDTTYRLYDYGRLDKDGNPRELHIEKGTMASNLTALTEFYEKPVVLPDGGEMLVSCPLFTTYRRFGGNSFNVGEDSFSSFTVVSGAGTIVDGKNEISVSKGDTVFITAGSGEVAIVGDIVAIDARM